MNVSATPSQSLSISAQRKLEEAVLRVRIKNVAIELWDCVFTENEKRHLGGELSAAYSRGGAIGMWIKLHGCTTVRAVIDIAKRLGHLSDHHREWLLREVGEFLDAEAAYEDAILRNDLVFNSLLHELHWKGQLIEFDWENHEAKWWYLWMLARHAKKLLPIDHTLFGQQKNSNYLSKTKSDLVNKICEFPIDFADAIKPAGTGSQRLHVPAEEIRVFEHYVGGEIREWQ